MCVFGRESKREKQRNREYSRRWNQKAVVTYQKSPVMGWIVSLNPKFTC